MERRSPLSAVASSENAVEAWDLPTLTAGTTSTLQSASGEQARVDFAKASQRKRHGREESKLWVCLQNLVVRKKIREKKQKLVDPSGWSKSLSCGLQDVNIFQILVSIVHCIRGACLLQHINNQSMLLPGAGFWPFLFMPHHLVLQSIGFAFFAICQGRSRMWKNGR